MKNIKLLLATTAILSMGALGANATNTTDPGELTSENATVNVSAEIIHARSLSASPLDFGKIVVPLDENEAGFMIDRDGNETVMPGGYRGYVLKAGSKGIVNGATCDELNWTEDLSFDGTDWYLDLDTFPTGGDDAKIQQLKCYTVENKATFYGNFHVNGYNDGTPSAGTYSGSFTVTVIPTIYDN